MLSSNSRLFCIDVDPTFTSPASLEGGSPMQNTRHTPEITSYDDEMITDPPSETEFPYHVSIIHPTTYSNKSKPLVLKCDTNVTSAALHHHNHPSTFTHTTVISPKHTTASSPHPLTDITRLRIRPQGHHCLHPGATFQGTQKSGRNSYDVNVTIVDVDFSSSFLCGYLRIRGLTDDWPELTTYFDAEIIGSRHGFLTQNWGATEQEDMVHWSRFPAFRHVRSELKKPHLTMADRDRGAVFMRWKERFLVPDHRVQDINGASFAGFYYVCVDFNPPMAPAPSARSTTQQVSLTLDADDVDVPFSQPMKPEAIRRARRDSSVRRAGVRPPSMTPRPSAPVATMSGFYYHQNSEPYQQLSLCHVPERASSSFEFR
ncbi:vacuolar import and degradation protein-domain-containing protein [Collybia nuda]|uniref:Vacuolar import and degradation protein-domain-containing protein n=1 Tax=Collybia nuda TaxID=64659 RepID=A0A9P5YH41_9AGAR|nr:vacuolar import and degradation protein-domain-containing protein [Collybia nuda]